MGAGIFAAYSHIPIHSRLLALAPWVVGIVAAIAARLIARVVTDRDGLIQFEKIQQLLGLLLMPPDSPGLAESASLVIRNRGWEARYAALKRLGRCSEVLGWVTHGLFAAGVIVIAWRLS
jgi:hypothetical protein